MMRPCRPLIVGGGMAAFLLAGVLFWSLGIPKIKGGKETMPEKGRRYNRLIFATSPYLRQHADNPVDWFPWGEEAFEKARRQGKPIFLSIGYSTCYWCHVMERESFEDEEIARILNEHFIAIKVDREERADVDEVYMQAVLIFTGGHGGWPMSVFLTPDLKPFAGGTYFPPEQFKRLLLEIARLWREERERIMEVADQVARLIASELKATMPLPDALTETTLRLAEEALLRSLDRRYGGFSGPPKFPPHQALLFLLRRYERTKRLPLWEAAELTLRQMARGGIYDHIGGGFHRYSVDEKWLVPHFEKMLYDNAQLAQVYAYAYALRGDPSFRRIAEETYEFVLREMVSEEGTFYSALDAESPPPLTAPSPQGLGKEEGAFYLWRPHEVKAVLGEKDGGLFCKVYDITDEGNFHNPHTHYGGSIPNLIKAPVENWAKALRIDTDELWGKLETMRQKLLEARNKRPRPHRDEKILVSWNALMIRSLAWGYRYLMEDRYLKAAQRAAESLWTTMRRHDGTFWRNSLDGKRAVDAMLDDYAFFLVALVDLYDVTRDRKWLERAEEVAETLIRLFWDDQGRGFWFTPGTDKNLFARIKRAYDGAEPSGNGMGALGLLMLAEKVGKERYAEIARQTIETFGQLLVRTPHAAMTLLLALDEWLAAGREPVQVMEERPIQGVWVEPKRLTLKAGEAVPLKVHLRIAPGWHINGYQPPPNLVPTRLTGQGKLVLIERIEFPPTEEEQFPFADRPIRVYKGTVTFTLWVRAKEGVRGQDTLTLMLRYQACDESRCLAPSRLTLTVPVLVR